MRVLVTGANGFIGQRLVNALLEGEVVNVAGQTRTLEKVYTTDRSTPPDSFVADARVNPITGDLGELLDKQALPTQECDAVIHLAAAVSGECEADLELGIRANLMTTADLLLQSACAAKPPVFVFASSVAVYGSLGQWPEGNPVSDETAATPTNSYGTQKLACELLVADAHRKGLIQGRSLRLMTCAVRPGLPNKAASGFISAIIREPLAGRAVDCPVPRDTRIAILSPRKTVQGLLAGLAATNEKWGSQQGLLVPALTTTPAEVVGLLRERFGQATSDLVRWTVDERTTAIVKGWPTEVVAQRAGELGIQADASLDAIVDQYTDELR